MLAFAVHEVDSYTDVYADDTKITSAQITAVSGNANDGKITATKYANAMWVRRYTGTTSQTVDWILNNRYPTQFPSTSRGREIAYAAMSFDWGDGKLYRGPPLMTFVIKGKKCYDPRLDTSPGADPTNAAYAALTENPALCWADYAMADYGGATPSTYIDWASVVTAADVCDDLVNIPGATTQKRYTFNGRVVLPIDPDWRQNAKLFIDAMLGRMVFRDGKWFCYAGAWEAASYSIERTDWLDIGRIKTVAPRDGGRWNTVRCWYVDPDRNWQRVECFPRRNATYKSADGAEEISLEMAQPGCTSEYEAQRKAEFLLRQSRNQIALTGKLGPRFRKMATGEVVALNFEELGWVSKLMRIRTMTLDPDGSVDVGLVEEQEADWTDLAAGEYNAPSSATVPDVNPTSPSEPQNITITPMIGGVMIDFDPPLVKPIGTRYRVLMASSPGDATLGIVAWNGDADFAMIGNLDPTTKFWWVQAFANSYYSAYSPNSAGTLGRALPVDDNTFSQRVFVDEEFQFDASSRHWWITTPTFMTSSAEIVPNVAFATGGVLRAYLSANSIDQIVVIPKRTPPQTGVANQVYGVSVRAMRATGVTTGFITVSVLHCNTVGVYTPQSTGLVIQDSRADNKERIDIALGSFGTGSNWTTAQGWVMGPNSANPSYPFLRPLVTVLGKGGIVDIDRVAMWVANSVAATGSYYIA